LPGDIYFAQAFTPPARLVWGGAPMPAIDPQPVGDHPTAQRLTRNRTTIHAATPAPASATYEQVNVSRTLTGPTCDQR
jgi:hypothetical protein